MISQRYAVVKPKTEPMNAIDLPSNSPGADTGPGMEIFHRGHYPVRCYQTIMPPPPHNMLNTLNNNNNNTKNYNKNNWNKKNKNDRQVTQPCDKEAEKNPKSNYTKKSENGRSKSG